MPAFFWQAREGRLLVHSNKEKVLGVVTWTWVGGWFITIGRLLIHYYREGVDNMSKNYSASPTVENLHSLPHYDLKFKPVDNTFNTDDRAYIVRMLLLPRLSYRSSYYLFHEIHYYIIFRLSRVWIFRRNVRVQVLLRMITCSRCLCSRITVWWVGKSISSVDKNGGSKSDTFFLLL